MVTVKFFEFNAFSENTYVLSDESKECIIMDPGNSKPDEDEALANYIAEMSLNPVRLILTHSHIDHILGNQFIFDTYGLAPELHKGELFMLQEVEQIGQMYGIAATASPAPKGFIEDKELVQFGNTELKAIFNPGHSAASLSFYCADEGFVIAGDALFNGSIGRTDLPGGDHQTLITSIKTRLLVLPDDTIVYCGHGPSTTIGQEKRNNPFLQ